jgi:hypothetical protein
VPPPLTQPPRPTACMCEIWVVEGSNLRLRPKSATRATSRPPAAACDAASSAAHDLGARWSVAQDPDAAAALPLVGLLPLLVPLLLPSGRASQAVAMGGRFALVSRTLPALRSVQHGVRVVCGVWCVRVLGLLAHRCSAPASPPVHARIFTRGGLLA